MSELKDCPCCGNKGYLMKAIFTYFDEYVVGCKQCGIRTGSKNTPEDAIKVWNKRKEEGADNEL